MLEATMIRIVAMPLLAVLLAIGISNVSVGQNSARQNVIVADKLDWKTYPAHFIDSPSSIKDMMRAAVEQLIRDEPAICNDHSHLLWACNPLSLRYLIGVSGSGQLVKAGYACSANVGIPFQRFYAETLLRATSCIELGWDFSAHAYFAEAGNISE